MRLSFIRFYNNFEIEKTRILLRKNVQEGKDQEEAQSEKDSHSKNELGKN